MQKGLNTKRLKSILFIPVSSSQGIGEYSRSLIIAQYLQQNDSSLNIQFILNEKAPYTKDCPFTTFLSQGSATKDTYSVKQSIDKAKPDLVIFDCSGRSSQYRYAKKSGAKVIFISQHAKKRNKGLKLKRLRHIDLHWVVQPDFMMPSLNLWQKLKLQLYKKKSPKNIGVVYSQTTRQEEKECLNHFQLESHQFLLFSAGSGAHRIKGQLISDIFYNVILKLAPQINIPAVIIFGQNYPKKIPDPTHGIYPIHSITNNDFISLLKHAKGRILSSGDTLLQSIALKKPSIAIATINNKTEGAKLAHCFNFLSKTSDQAKRLTVCEQFGFVIKSKPTEQDLLIQTQKLLMHTEITAIQNNLDSIETSNSLNIIEKDIKSLFFEK